MPVTKRGNSYQAQLNHGGQRYRRQFTTSSEADLWLAESKARLLRGEPIDMGVGSTLGPLTLSGLLDEVYAKYWARAKAGHTAIQNAQTCIKTIGNIRPSQVTTSAIDAAVAQWSTEGVAPGTINRRLSALSKMLRHAHERGYISGMPVLKREKEYQGRIRYLSKEEEQTVVGYFRLICRPSLADLVQVAVDTGMRRGELLRLKWEDCDSDHIRVWETKNGKPRSVPMTQRVIHVLNERRESNPHTTSVFHDLTEDMVRQGWDRVRSHMKLTEDRGFVFHALRHTFVSRLVQRGVNLRVVAALAGHTTITTTMRYAHLAPENLVDAINLLEQESAA